MAQQPPAFSTEQQGSVAILALHRDSLDPMTIEEFYEAALKVVSKAPQGLKLVIDLEPMEYMPSRFLGVLLDLHKAVEDKKGQLRLCGIRPNPLGVFKLMRLDTLLQIDKDRAASLAAPP